MENKFTKTNDKLTLEMEYSLFDMLGKSMAKAITSGELSPKEAGQMILSSDLSTLGVTEDDKKQYISNLMKGTNISGY